MVVITLTDCPAALKGDLTQWLQEIDQGVYAGQIGARVRDELWARVKANAKKGRATMVFTAMNEQRMDFRVHNGAWEPIDFDGLKLMLRPSITRIHEKCVPKEGYSKAAKMHMARKMAAHRLPRFPDNVVAIDVETTGLLVEYDQIIEIGAVKAIPGEPLDVFSALISITTSIPAAAVRITGITDEQLVAEGRPLCEVLPELLSFVGDLPVVSHNVSFDMSFLRAACERCGLPPMTNHCEDTLAMSRRWINEVENYKLGTLLAYFNLPFENTHRSREDCLGALRLYQKLIEICESKK